MSDTSYTARDVSYALQRLANPEIAAHSQRFFKTGPGEYGEGDRFLGIRVPVQRKVARQYRSLSYAECEILLSSPLHECRLTALFILVNRFKKVVESEQQMLHRLYIRNRRFVNNWDLVDSSAPYLMGEALIGRDQQILHDWARDGGLWERRIAMLATLAFIRIHDFTCALQIAAILRNDPEDLIQKAVGWMLREIGKKDQRTEESFLKRYYTEMPRTMLRYAIERFDEPLRKAYLNGNI